jgi:hypothetical protein
MLRYGVNCAKNGVLTKFKRAEPAGLVNLVKMRHCGRSTVLAT